MRQKLILSIVVAILMIVIMGPAATPVFAVPYNWNPNTCYYRNGEGGLLDAFAWFVDELMYRGPICNVGYGH